MESASTPPIFPRLASGPRKMDPEAVARHQRGRLEGAMVDSVGRNGYAGTTLRELVGLAGVSKSTFYEHFSSKEECFLDTFDDIIAAIVRRIDTAFDDNDVDLRGRLTAGVAMLMETAAEEQAAAYLVIVESLTLGSAGVERRDSASERLERFVWEGFERSGATANLSEITVRGIVAGIRNSIYQRLRRDKADELPSLVEPVVDWIVRYAEPPGARARRAIEVASRPAPALPPPQTASNLPGWDEPPDSPQSRSVLSQRERIIRAAARVGVAKGYASLSIPAISTAAGVSNQTFYDHFPGKREAFVAAFDALAAEALRRVAAAFETQPERPDSVGVGLRALLEHIAADDLFARLAFFELPAAGPPALDLADRVLGGFTSFLGPNDRADVPTVVKESLGGGIWAVIQHEIVTGNAAGLPERAPQITEFVMAPFHPPDDEPGTPG